ncbi:phage tail protein [Silvimonas sp. JCM 19000]
MPETFTWSPLLNGQGTTTLRTQKAQFGDGYSQIAADGLNNITQSWPVSFTGGADKIQAIRDFLEQHAGSASFYWTPPLGKQGLYRAASYTLNPLGAGKYTLSTTFDQSFAP